MKSRRLYIVAAVAAIALAAGWTGQHAVWAHCQIPCGIYDDGLRFSLIKEHIGTIEKTITLIQEASADPAKNAVQIARLASNKDEYADQIAELVSTYFLQQRVKPLASGASAEETAAYTRKLVLCHELLVTSMKAKQNTDKQYTEKLSQLLQQFQEAYGK